LIFGFYQIGPRTCPLTTTLNVAQGHDVSDFSIFPGDMTDGTQSVIAVPAYVPVYVSYLLIAYPPPEGFLVTFKIVIQRPIDPSLSYNVTWG